MKEEIVVKGAKENNLKNIDVKIPRNTLTVFTADGDTYTYEYDADGNVTKRTGTYSNAGISGELREIITYEVRTLPADYEPYDLKAFLL